MWSLYADGDLAVKPCPACYVIVLSAWSSITNCPEALYRAQAIFDDLLSKYDAGDEGMKPTRNLYITMIVMWSRSNAEDAGHRALGILNEMDDRHKIDKRNERPGLFHFGPVINAFAQAGDTENAEQVFVRMRQTNRIEPNLYVINLLLKAYARSGANDAVEKSEHLLLNMSDFYGWNPDVVSFTTFLYCLSQSGSLDAYEKSKAVIHHMVESTAAGDHRVHPNVGTFATMLLILNKTTGVVRAEEAEHVEELMQICNVIPTETIEQALAAARAPVMTLPNDGSPP
jgi:pentatricopeptide repeat protein